LAHIDTGRPFIKVERDRWAVFEPDSTTTVASLSVFYNDLRAASFIGRSLAIGSILALTACGVATVDNRGNLPEPEKLAQIHAGSTTRDQVTKILGTPSSTGVFNDNSWYYISRKTRQVAFLDPTVTDQQVYVINFDGKGVVRSIDHKNLQDGADIAMAPGATPAPGRELTFLEQVLGNIGRFTKGGSSGSGDTGDTGSQQGPKPYDPKR
jgi:outer membrane protein assembly factor BamE (lipoprotein component of BamABCDE complex)